MKYMKVRRVRVSEDNMDVLYTLLRQHNNTMLWSWCVWCLQRA